MGNRANAWGRTESGLIGGGRPLAIPRPSSTFLARLCLTCASFFLSKRLSVKQSQVNSSLRQADCPSAHLFCLAGWLTDRTD